MAKDSITKFEDRRFLPVVNGVDNTIAKIRGAVGEKGLTWRNFERAINPASGDAEWKMEDLDGSVMRFDSIEGIIVYHKMTRSYWKTDYKGGGTPPDCASEDGIYGVGNPGGECDKCPFSKFGSGKNNSQACRQIKQIFLMKENELLPTLINLSPINSEKATTFFLKLLSRKQLSFNEIVTKLVMTPDKSNSGFDYGDVKFVMLEEIPEEIRSEVAKLTEMFDNNLGSTIEASYDAVSNNVSESYDPAPDSEETKEVPDF